MTHDRTLTVAPRKKLLGMLQHESINNTTLFRFTTR